MLLAIRYWLTCIWFNDFLSDANDATNTQTTCSLWQYYDVSVCVCALFFYFHQSVLKCEPYASHTGDIFPQTLSHTQTDKNMIIFGIPCLWPNNNLIRAPKWEMLPLCTVQCTHVFTQQQQNEMDRMLWSSIQKHLTFVFGILFRYALNRIFFMLLFTWKSKERTVKTKMITRMRCSCWRMSKRG